MNNIETFLEEIEEILPNVKIDYLKLRSYLVRNDIPSDKEPATVMDRLAGHSIVCKCENSEYSLLFDVNTRKEPVPDKNKYRIKTQENTMDITLINRCIKCEKYTELKRRAEDLRARIGVL